MANLRLSGKVALAVASSGIAATLLSGGRTAHNRFKLTIDVTNCKSSVKRYLYFYANIRGTFLAGLFLAVELIIWDEAPMSNRCNMEALDVMLRDIRETNKPFGGVYNLFILILGDCGLWW